MLWEHEQVASVSTAFLSTPKLSRLFLSLSRNTQTSCFLFLLENTTTQKRKSTFYFDHQNVNSLCLPSLYHWINIIGTFF